jgi:hypothetical protein
MTQVMFPDGLRNAFRRACATAGHTANRSDASAVTRITGQRIDHEAFEDDDRRPSPPRSLVCSNVARSARI